MGAPQSNDQDDLVTDINITPFVDVVLVLLVIFMVAAPMMATQILELKLPQATSSKSAEGSQWQIVITNQGQYVVDGKAMTLLELTELAQRDQDKQKSVIIAADGRSEHRFVIDLIDLLKREGFERFAFQIERQDQVEAEQ
jgi:biopolymer transport protein ExbD